MIQLETESAPPAIRACCGRRCAMAASLPGSLPPLGEVWELAQANLRALPEQWRALKVAEPFPFASARRCKLYGQKPSKQRPRSIPARTSPPTRSASNTPTPANDTMPLWLPLPVRRGESSRASEAWGERTPSEQQVPNLIPL